MSNADVPNPFASARRVPGVTVRLQPSDIVDGAHGLTIAEAERLLDRHGSNIAAQMLIEGVRVAAEIIQQEGTAT